MQTRRAGAIGAALLLMLAFGSAPTLASPSVGGMAVAGPGPNGELTVGLTSGAVVHVLRPHGAHGGLVGATGVSTGNGINYNGGPIVPSEKVDSIYWSSSTIYQGGPAAGTTGTAGQDGSLVGYFLGHLGGSNYYNINTTYGDTVGAGHTVANALTYSGFWADSGGAPTSGTSVSDSSIQTEIVKGLDGGQLTYDPSTVYAVFSGSGVNLGGGFLSQYCAYHGYFTSAKYGVILYAVLPYDYVQNVCSLLSGSPNGDPAADAEVNTIAHELEEANTDPQLNAWYDSAGNENADKCAWNFGSTFTTGNGSTANVTVGADSFLVQQNWLNANGGGCAQGYAGSAPPTVPGAPTSLRASAGSGSVGLTWTAPASNGGATITNYDVYRGLSSAGETFLTQVGNVTSYKDGSVTNGTTYYYTVAAVNVVGAGAQSNVVSATPTAAGLPGAPPTLSATTSSFRRGVQLNWTVPPNNGSAISSYKVYRGTTSGGETLLTTRGASSTSYRDSSTTSGQIYYYRVSAVNGVGEGPQSTEASARAR